MLKEDLTTLEWLAWALLVIFSFFSFRLFFVVLGVRKEWLLMMLSITFAFAFGFLLLWIKNGG